MMAECTRVRECVGCGFHPFCSSLIPSIHIILRISCISRISRISITRTHARTRTSPSRACDPHRCRTPVESIAYIQAATIPLFFRSGCHPWIHLYTKLDLIIGAQIGHDGFDATGGGSYFHQLHHAHFECNYGDAAVPMDWLFGTFEDGSKWSSEHKTALRKKANKGNLDPSVADAAEKEE